MAKTGSSAWIDGETAALADLLLDHLRQQPGIIGRLSRSLVIREALWSLVRETPDLDEEAVRAEVRRRLEAGGG